MSKAFDSQSNFIPWLVTSILTLVTAVEILDMTIVSVSLKDMGGALGATQEQISWTVTSYVVMSAIVMPLSGFLTARLGRIKLLLAVVVGFGIFSMLCGLSTSLEEMIIFRGFQGAFGALMAPISQSIITELFMEKDKSKLGAAMGIYGMGVMAAPVFGPIMGGYLTENVSWHWDFFVNIPIIMLVLPLLVVFIKDTEKQPKNIDWYGLLLMSLCIGAFQVTLDQGASKDWFDSNLIVILSGVSLVSFIVFLLRGIKLGPQNIINLNLFRDRLFTGSSIILMFFVMIAVGLVTWLPQFLQTLLGYPAFSAGEAISVRGIFGIVGMMLVSALIRKVPAYLLVITGLVLTACSSYLMMTSFSLLVNDSVLFVPNILQGLAIGFIFLPLMELAFQGFSSKDRDEASGLFNSARSIGSSIGVSIMATINVSLTQVNWNELGGQLSPLNPNLRNWLHAQGYSLSNLQDVALLQNMLGSQSAMIAFNDILFFTMLLSLLMIPMAFLLKKPGGWFRVEQGHEEGIALH
ncbi:DHA2 family efflux MFS transporter permease subunit [Dongshaea marina]|uniref:DHA2 family efflux MFS transporter permease subunit n=1 Tax=Dongshaea marina TaxID=2047966 RepID=UPI000D3E7BF2|nr:DHA2 family efflux MFS transporter permease subunit [Dongshaea marina]